MGFSVVPLAQKARTKTLIADSDLNLGIYDLIATDVKGDTAEFDEFVGGVGNFSNVLGSGNLDIEGTGNIKGLTTFQNGVQINGALHVEGSINNVNIADNGEITTSQGVNGADFNGAKITSTTFNNVPVKHVITVTPTNATTLTPNSSVTNMDVLLPIAGIVYSGSVRVRNTYGIVNIKISYTTDGYTYTEQTISSNQIYVITLSNATCLRIYALNGYLGVDGISLS